MAVQLMTPSEMMDKMSAAPKESGKGDDTPQADGDKQKPNGDAPPAGPGNEESAPKNKD